MTSGWTGRVLEIDLFKQTHRVIEPDKALYEKFVGGKGMAGHYLSEHATVSWDDPQMPVLMFTGPLVGTNAPTSGRMTVVSRSPQTGTVADASVGGAFGTKLKKSGYDGIIIRGRAGKWTGVEIDNTKVRFTDASQLTRLPLPLAYKKLNYHGSTAMIGPAAERGVIFASLMVDRHFAAARGGIGLCFANKRLKYVSVNGTKEVAVANKSALKRAREDILRLVAASQILMGEHGIAALGTPALYDLVHTRRMMPTDNFKETFFEHAPKLNADSLRRTYSPQKVGCTGCHILCKKKSSNAMHLPEYETLAHFTALLKNTDLNAAVQANTLCNDFGMDTISVAGTLAAHSEITGEDITGERIVELIRNIGEMVGIGAKLAQGSARYAAEAGYPQASMSVKNLELPAYDPRGAYGMSLAYAVSTRGGCHLRAYPIGHEILRKPVATDRFSFDGKARIIKISEDNNALVDSLTACKFVFFASSFEEYAAAFTAITGVSMTATDLSLIGERIYYQDKLLNARWGFDAKDDDLPARFFNEPGTNGPGFNVPAIDRDAFLNARDKYYKIRGVDANGVPTRKTAQRLGLPWID